MHEKKVLGKTDMQMMWEDMNDDQRKAILRAMVCSPLASYLQCTFHTVTLHHGGPLHHRGTDEIGLSTNPVESYKVIGISTV